MINNSQNYSFRLFYLEFKKILYMMCSFLSVDIILIILNNINWINIRAGIKKKIKYQQVSI